MRPLSRLCIAVTHCVWIQSLVLLAAVGCTPQSMLDDEARILQGVEGRLDVWVTRDDGGNGIHVSMTGCRGDVLRELKQLERLRSLSICTGPPTDAEVELIASLTPLRRLALSGRFTDVHMRQIMALPHLRELRIASPLITDEGMKALGRWRHAHTLALHCEGVTSAGVAHALKAQSLECLDLGRTPVTDEIMEMVSGLPKLQSLGLAYTRISDSGVQRLAQLRRLQRLDLSCTAISDSAIAPLAKLPNLRKLGLGGTQLTRVGLLQVAALKGLVYAVLPPQAAADGEVEDVLKGSLPGTEILYSDGPMPAVLR